MTDEQRHDRLRDRLLTSETWDPRLHEQYQAGLQALLIQKLTPVRRWSLVFVAVLMLGSAFLCGWLAATQSKLPVLARICLVEAVVLQLVAALYCLRVVRSGSFHRRFQPAFLSGLVWCFAVLLAVHFLALIPTVSDVRTGILLLGVTLMTLVVAGVQLLRTCIEQSELNTHEKLLEAVLRLTGTRPSSG
jgi:hypothetical protein